ncbi:MAG: 30S ribosomal protein S6 [Bacilli bacterium]
MKNYEIMYILMPNLEADATKAEIEALHKILTDNGAKITGVKEWGMRDLAYEIKKQTKGYYVVTEFTAEPTAVEEFNKAVAFNAKVVRFLITVTNQ